MDHGLITNSVSSAEGAQAAFPWSIDRAGLRLSDAGELAHAEETQERTVPVRGTCGVCSHHPRNRAGGRPNRRIAADRARTVWRRSVCNVRKLVSREI